MKRYSLKSSLFAGLCALLLSFSCFRQDKLTDISKPYLGEYECISATLGSKDLIKDFSFIRLELKGEETFCLRYRDKNGRRGEEQGYYRYDEGKGEITLFLQAREDLKRSCSLKNGELCLQVPIGKQILVMKFQQK